MVRRALALLFTSGLVVSQLLASSSALAQAEAPVPGPSAKPAVTPPRVLVNQAAEYPAQALKERIRQSVTVVLLLDIDAAGNVTRAVPEAPQGHGFDEAAVAAAQKLKFEPARRGDAPIAVRIKFPYVFSPPAPVLVGRVARQGSQSDAPVANARVTVRAADGSERVTTSDANGAWRITGLGPGAVQIRIEVAGYQPASLEEQLASGEETKLIVRLAAVAPAAEEPEAAEEEPTSAVEVFVEGERPPREVTRRTLSRNEMSTMPGSFGDALRSIQNLPGVARPPPFSGLLIVRGSAPDDTAIVVDGTWVPLIYHFGGLSSVVPTELIEKIDFFPGNYSVMYGNSMGGLIDVGLRNPTQDGRFHGLAQIDLIDARLMLEGPIAKTGWTFLAAGRRSWIDTWLGPVLKEAGFGVTAAPRYYDYQLMVQRHFSADSSFRLAFFGSDDALEILNQSPTQSAPQFGGEFRLRTNFWRLQALYKNRFDQKTELRSMASIGQDSFDIGFGSDYGALTITPMALRTELSHGFMRGLKANIGLDLNYGPYEFVFRFRRIPRPGEPGGGPGDVPVETIQKDDYFAPGAYTELEILPARGTRIVPGVRLDYATTTEAWDVSPRINARQDLTSGFPRTTIKGGVGIFRQAPDPFEADPVFGATDLKSNTSVHYGLGFEQEFTRQIELSTDIFYKDFSDLVVQGSGNTGEGRAFGVEWLLRYKEDDRFFGWLAYTLSRSEVREFADYPLHLSQWDQTHILTLLGSYKLGRGWKLGARFRYVSGNLYTPLTTGAYDATTGTPLEAPTFPPFSTRMPAFNQLDMRVDKQWTFSAWKLTAYLDVLNVLNRQNTEAVVYNYNYTKSSQVSGLPILPNLGIRGEF
ncbi:MAG TPA: TonB family protein [Polyangiaceae bacterium]|nr:TonB family protein [Polyangiaceae bacterium]